MKWNINEFINNFTEVERRLDIGDNIQILYKEKLTPIKINGEIRPELKIIKGSYCVYELEEEEYFSSENRVEMIAIEEYSDSPYSIYINEEGNVEGYEYENISTIELGNTISIHILNEKISEYSIFSKHKEAS